MRGGGADAAAHPHAAAPLEAVAADEAALLVLGALLGLQVAEAGDVEAARLAVVVGARLADQVLEQAAHARPHEVLAEVVAHVPARVADAVGVLPGLRQQQQPGRLEGRGGHHHRARLDLVALAGLAVEEGDAPGPAGLLVDQDLVHGGVGAQGELARSPWPGR